MLFLFIISCSIEDELDYNKTTVEETQTVNLNRNLYKEKPLNIPEISKTELIIQYKNNVTQTQKATLRAKYDVKDNGYEGCNCTDGSIEKWQWNETDSINVEDKKNSMRAEEGGVEGLIKNVDNEFSFKREKKTVVEDNITIGTGTTFLNYQSFIKDNDRNSVIIAVLDTGVNVNYKGFKEKFLYDATGTQYSVNIGFSNQISGWDFANEDDDTDDDYAKIHGTKVINIIHQKLFNEKISNQILPIKVADNNGRVSAFNLVCGIKSAVEIADIVNLSLGYYSNGEDHKSTIIESLIIEYNHVLFVTSAGNNGSDNDEKDAFNHYPSDYPQENVLSIAAADPEGIRRADFSNYGAKSVDFYAIGEDVKFIEYGPTNIIRKISGTSYAAPYVTAVVAKIFFETRLQPSGIIQKLDMIGVPIDEDGEKVKYGKIIK